MMSKLDERPSARCAGDDLVKTLIDRVAPFLLQTNRWLVKNCQAPHLPAFAERTVVLC